LQALNLPNGGPPFAIKNIQALDISAGNAVNLNYCVERHAPSFEKVF
jgi:hypothetical protein